MSLVLEVGWLGLTPWERLSKAADHWGDPESANVLVVFLSIALVVLLVLFSLASIQRGRQGRKRTLGSFEEYAGEKGLSIRERDLLAVVAEKAGLKRPESVFEMRSAFDRGTAAVIEEACGSGRTTEDIEQLKIQTTFLGDKLGFSGNGRGGGESSERRNRVSTRDIPAGKSLYIHRQKSPGQAGIEATVARKSDAELAVKPSEPVNVVFGQTWCVRYYSGSSVWEFDTTIVSYDGDTLVFRHSEDVRFVNRRRFLRVSVRLRAFIARFPFRACGDAGEGVDSDGALGRHWAPPRFVPGIVTEMAGPGLRIESSLEAKTGERVLVVLNLCEHSLEGSEAGEAQGLRVMESTGEVKYVKAAERGFSIAVELTGLDESEVDELVRATNAASLQSSERREKVAFALGNGV
ncbi:MAG: PilZ domain-containing protein [Planctomycetota bacterium]